VGLSRLPRLLLGQPLSDSFSSLSPVAEQCKELLGGDAVGYRLLCLALKPLMRHLGGDHVLFAIDDTPTARYGPKVQGAGIHHNPTPGPAGEKFVYGHIWVTLAWLVRHPAWDTLSLPLRALLYVRAKDVAKLAKHYQWSFRTKLELPLNCPAGGLPTAV
jgi:hypothetical protein